MPGYLVQATAVVLCAHSGSARPIDPDRRVKLGGIPVATQGSTYAISGCRKKVRCVTGRFVSVARRVKASGRPVVLKDSQAVCTPNGTGLTVVNQQSRVKGR
jgi:uncharacterized Zn-binding protein involved in type VI secretion